MKANELMIGDWVLYDDRIVYVLEVTEDYIYELKEGYKPVDLAEPMPLTPEILEKNGFSKNSDEEFVYLEGGNIAYNVCVDFKWGIISMAKIDNYGTEDECTDYVNDFHFKGQINVHELQHALRLCGLNDLADNFQV